MGLDTDFERRSREHTATLGQFLRALREQKELSPIQIASRMAVHKNTVYNIEKNAVGVSVHRFIAYCDALKEPAERVLGFYRRTIPSQHLVQPQNSAPR